MSEDYLVRQAAPTLAGMKTGSLFPCAYDSYEALKTEIRSLNRALHGKGLRLLPLRRSQTRALLYLYRPARLGKDLSAPAASSLLRKAGYNSPGVPACLRELIRRFQSGEEFPHEIGLFLSYPPEDVKGFIEHHGYDGKCTGYWKVYGDSDRAQRTFRAYKACTDRCCRQCAMGVPVAELAADAV
jgi:hypothetical protein